MKNDSIFQNNKWEEEHHFTFLQMPLKYGFIEDCSVLISLSTFRLKIYCSGWINKENLALYRHIVRKGKNILVAFSDNCGYSSVILYQNSISRGFQ